MSLCQANLLLSSALSSAVLVHTVLSGTIDRCYGRAGTTNVGCFVAIGDTGICSLRNCYYRNTAHRARFVSTTTGGTAPTFTNCSFRGATSQIQRFVVTATTSPTVTNCYSTDTAAPTSGTLTGTLIDITTLTSATQLNV